MSALSPFELKPPNCADYCDHKTCNERRKLRELYCVECKRPIRYGDFLHVVAVSPLRVVHRYDQAPEGSCYHRRQERRAKERAEHG